MKGTLCALFSDSDSKANSSCAEAISRCAFSGFGLSASPSLSGHPLRASDPSDPSDPIAVGATNYFALEDPPAVTMTRVGDYPSLLIQDRSPPACRA
jgi:hypothetical protein